MAMVCDDAVVRGGVPVLVKSVLDVNTLGSDSSRLPYIEQLAKGYIKAAKEANVAIINGELAQLNDRIGHMDEFRLEWSADLTWFAHESRLITGYDVKAGDSIVSLRETGLRCNGISLVRRLLKDKYGEKWETKKLNAKPLIELALQPSQIYSAAVVAMFGGYDLKQKPQAKLHAVAHISGGGIPEKLGRNLSASGLGAMIDNPFPPCDLMLHCQKLGNVSDSEAYRTWNMGNGMLIVTPEPDKVIAVAKKYGIQAQTAGRVTAEPGITIANQGYFAKKQPEVKF
jgi:phosphoribosylformylglycinamidine cyclo-ligase